MAMGIARTALFKRTIIEQEFQMEPGDRVISYTNGLVDAMNSRCQRYGMKRLVRMIKRHRTESSANLIKFIITDLHRFTAGHRQSDEQTLLRSWW